MVGEEQPTLEISAMTTQMTKFARTVLFASMMVAGSVQAAPFVLDFEGLGDQEQVLNYYNGGLGGAGSGPGPNDGVVFSSNGLALIDSDAGGTGNFGNEPSPNTILFFLLEAQTTMNVAAGFDTGFSFYYSTNTPGAFVTVYDALGGAGGGGNILGTINLPVNVPGSPPCQGDPTGGFCNWDPVGVAFAGTAYSVDFGGAANFVGFDNVTFGSDAPCTGNNCNNVPEPASLALVGLGVLALAAGRRRKARS
jgi:hypothetical protein